jgi:hypothetical protein
MVVFSDQENPVTSTRSNECQPHGSNRHSRHRRMSSCHTNVCYPWDLTVLSCTSSRMTWCTKKYFRWGKKITYKKCSQIYFDFQTSSVKLILSYLSVEDDSEDILVPDHYDVVTERRLKPPSHSRIRREGWIRRYFLCCGKLLVRHRHHWRVFDWWEG